MLYLKSQINFEEVASTLQPRFPDQSLNQIQEAFERFFWADERSDFWYYTQDQCQEVVAQMLSEFIEDVSGIPIETMAGRTARETGLELIGEPAEVNVTNWMVVS